jgi:protein SCO1
MRLWLVYLTFGLIALTPTAALASQLDPAAVASLTFDQHVGESLPPELEFTDDMGSHVTLNDYFGQGRPVILSLNYFHCQYLCPIEEDGLINGLNGVSATLGQDYTLLTVSIDPADGHEDAALVKARGLRGYDRPQGDDGWHLLTAEQSTLDQLTQSVGFHDIHDPQASDFAHPVGVVILTPAGQISRYLYGIDFSSTDLGVAISDAGQARTGSGFERALLICYQYDPLLGGYTSFALNLLRIGGAVTLLVTVVFLGRLWRADLRRGST